MVSTLLKFYRLLSILSLDVAVGAVCSSVWFADFFGVKPGGIAFTVLGLTVWIIYTLDHLVDARTIKSPANAKRYQFHQQHFSIIGIVWMLAIVCDGVLVFFMRKEILYDGLWLSALVIIYFLFHRYVGFLKEFTIAVLYTVGVLLPTLSLKGAPPIASEWAVISSFLLTALINILLFSWVDHDADVSDGQHSFAIVFGRRHTQKFVNILFIAQVILQFVIIYWGGAAPVILLLSMNSVLLFIFYYAERLKKNDSFRLAGDAVFFFPAVALFLRWIF
jgi:4-hydroxybenzoate polyprenyltransferase